MNDAEREQIIRDSIKAITTNGIKLGIQSWGLDYKTTKGKEHWKHRKGQTCCALACVLLANQDIVPVHLRDWRSYSVEKLLETNSSWVRSFQKGFDGYKKSQWDTEDFAFELGVMIREELIV